MPLRRISFVLPLLLIAAGCSRASTDPGAPEPRVSPSPPVAAAGSAAYTPWPSAMHDARHSGSTSVIGPTTGRVRWTRTLESNVTPGPAVAADGTIYAASNAGILHALDPTTGADRWTLNGGGPYGTDLSTTPTILKDGRIAWPGPSDSLIIVSADGHVLCRESLHGFVMSPAIGANDVLYVADASGSLTAFQVADGCPRRTWSIDLGNTTHGSPAIGPDGTVYQTVDSLLIAIQDLGDRARERWRFDTKGEVQVSATVGLNGTTVVGSNDPHEYGLDSSGTVRWTYRRDAVTRSSPVISDSGLSYFGDQLGRVHVVEEGTGILDRRYETHPSTAPQSVGVSTAPAIDVRHNAYFGTSAGHIYGFDFSGRQLFDIDAGASVDSYPAITGDGTLLIGSAKGVLYAIRD